MTLDTTKARASILQRIRARQGRSAVSGPSRTGDIEQTIVLGAHGRYRVYSIVSTSRSAR